MAFSNTVDVAINIYGKPYQTAVTLLSLLRYSEKWINTIYLIEEKEQPFGADIELVKYLLKDYKIVHYVPRYFLGISNLLKSYKRYLLKLPVFRYSIRYQYAWEKSINPYLFVTHNDVLYTDDLIGAFLNQIDDAIGIGKVGQCWNCPAYAAHVCEGNRYELYHPDFAEVSQLYERFGSRRSSLFTDAITPKRPWPLPECRLNEFHAMINLRVARPVTMPYGSAYPFGVADSFDQGARWFRQVSQMGLRVKHFESDSYAQHGWASDVRSGHGALSDQSVYEVEEQIAYDKLRTEFNIGERIKQLPSLKAKKWASLP